jgi:hypothetical protein
LYSVGGLAGQRMQFGRQLGFVPPDVNSKVNGAYIYIYIYHIYKQYSLRETLKRKP